MKRERIYKCRRCGFMVSNLSGHDNEEACIFSIAICIQAIVEQTEEKVLPSVLVARWVYDRYVARKSKKSEPGL